jgi:VanZ family protein
LIKRFIDFFGKTPLQTRRYVTGAYILLVAIASLAPSSTFKNVPPLMEGMDKAIHFLMYSAMALMIYWCTRIQMRFVHYLGIIFFCSAYGFVMEILQFTLTHGDRTFSWGDTTANVVGALTLLAIRRLTFGLPFGTATHNIHTYGSKKK